MSDTTHSTKSLTKTDPVCGMTVSSPKHHHFHRKQEYWFCGSGCKTKFVAHPQHYHPGFGKWLFQTRKKLQPLSSKILSTLGLARSNVQTEYTCPMHPEVKKIGPSTCPICGMALEPSLSTASSASRLAQEHADLQAYRRLQFRFFAAAILTLPVMIGEMTPWQSPSLLAPLLTTIIVFGFGSFIWTRAWNALRHTSLNMFSLIALGSIVAYGYSLGVTIIANQAPALIPDSIRKGDGSPYVYYETAAVIVTLVILGQLLEEAGRRRVAKKLNELGKILPEEARRLTEKWSPSTSSSPTVTTTTTHAATNLPTQSTPLETLAKGDHLLVLPGEAIPIDGIVLSGEGGISEALLTGESLPTDKHPGSEVLGGSINGDATFIIEVTKTQGETFLSSIMSLTEKALRERLPVQALTDRITTFFIPIVLSVAALSFILWAQAGQLSTAWITAISVLIIACPCALGLAVPMAISSGVGRGASLGILIRDPNALERLKEVSLIALDKTGTLTEGQPVLKDFTLAAPTKSNKNTTLETLAGELHLDAPRQNILQQAASLQALSAHPIAHAFQRAAEQAKLPVLPVEDFMSVTGAGVMGHIDGVKYILGSASFMERHGHKDTDFNHIGKVDSGEEDGLDPQASASIPNDSASLPHTPSDATIGSTVYFASEKEPLATFHIADTLRPSARETVRLLKSMGKEVVILSGDDSAVCKQVAGELAITRAYGKLLPTDKQKHIEDFKQAGHKVLMAGDGINDAPALAAAHVSVTIGSRSPIALEAADFAIFTAEIHRLVTLFSLGKLIRINIRLNLLLAFMYNTLSVPIAAGVLVLFGGPLLSPMLAGAMMMASSLSVIANALRIQFTRQGSDFALT